MIRKTTMSGAVFLLLFVFLIESDVGEGRYLPTRSNSDRIDKLRELLKELLENEIEREEIQQQQQDTPPRWHPDTKLFYKREVPTH